MKNWEINIVRYFNRLRGRKMDHVLGFINSIRFLVVFWGVIVAVVVARHPDIAMPFFLAVTLVAILHFGITEAIIKHLLTKVISKRKRPYVAYPKEIKPIGKRFSDSSFPSSHMATTCAMFFVISSFYPSLIIPALVFTAIMAFSRLHNGMHYPSDVLAGMILGLGYGWSAIEILKIVF